MKINLAGHNVDLDALNLALKDMGDSTLRGGTVEALTPEVLSAAYARISRDAASVDVLRRKAAKNVAKARKSNESIIFEMGHASVSEHAVFNFDVIDVSRLVIEAIEHARLASYTEKSQRYITFDREKDEFVIPFEIADAGLERQFRDFIKETHDQYHFILDRIKDQERPQGGSAMEDARYVTTLAVTGQLGMTINARNLEVMVRRLRSHPLHEAQQIGQELHDLVKEVAPSLVKYVEPEPLRQNMLEHVRSAVRLNLTADPRGLSHIQMLTAPGKDGEGDDFVLATLIHQAGLAPFNVCHATVSQMAPEMKFMLLRDLFMDMDRWTAAPRQWEMGVFTFEMVVSASCFAQLKRHRMATILPQDYDPSLGYVVPTSIQQDDKALPRFHAVMRAAEALHKKLHRQISPEVATYALTQSHRRRVLVSMNARELYAFSRLREDGHAQWEIRDAAHVMLGYAREVMPLTMSLACGKDKFEELKKKLFTPQDEAKTEVPA